MKIGYPCINRSLSCTSSKTFRLASYSNERLIETIKHNLSCLMDILKYNVLHNLLFFRVSSEIVPFASHPVCNVNWQKYFAEEFKNIGRFIKGNSFRISMHPDQFNVLNAKDMRIVERSIKELEYHADMLDLMNLDQTAKIQLHVGGVYGDKPASIERFIQQWHKLKSSVKKRLVIENDDKLYSLKDCLFIHNIIGIPVLFDAFHHQILNNGESMETALESASKTWNKNDGILMVDYSSKKTGGIKGQHTERIDISDFSVFLKKTKKFDYDIMLEIKDKEKSALKAYKKVLAVR
ncbi:MAG: UV DNA damage repair endonuclease UvsE [bacterium]